MARIDALFETLLAQDGSDLHIRHLPGEVVGEHTVFLFGDNDRLELTHRASDRRIFASGAYRAAHWVASQEPGLYSMRDVLGLKNSMKTDLK